MKTRILLCLIIAATWACSSTSESEAEPETEDKKSEMVMAEVSELAALMKEIHADAKDWRTALLNGETVTADTDIYTRLTESEPTNKNVEGPAFNGMSQHYQSKLSAFLAASDIELAKKEYNNLVSACVQCHQNYCHGPIPTIEKLYLPTAQK
ncbi:MAG: hypothetical protein LC670_11245 [Flavobacteriales bacterium]|nr:hypothetical protein [Flavobacteriales bacterium]